MIVKIPIVGIRNYLKNREADYPKLFARLPIGSIVYLRKQPTGSEYPGSVSVWVDDENRIGSVSKTERRFIELEIPEGGMLPVKISGHSAKDNCMFFTAENTKGVKEPYIREITLEEGETVFPLTEHDKRLLNLTAMMKTQIQMLKDGTFKTTEALVKTAEKYTQYCCTSLDGNTSFSRSDILMDLALLMEKYPELEPIRSDIFEKHKDIGRDKNDFKTQAYLEQYNRIKDSVLEKKENGRSEIDDYLNKIRFAHGGKLTIEIVEQEIMRLSPLLANEMMKSYEKNTQTAEGFATALYSLNYSMDGIYRLYTRQIKLDELKKLKEQMKAEAPEKAAETEKADDAKVPNEPNTASNFFVHPAVLDEKEQQEIIQSIQNVVRGKKLQDICKFLNKLEDEKKVLQPINVKKAQEELQRLGMPGEETYGFSYKTFDKYYRK